ncbi:hypothetical protein [Stenotrophomonas maltophilia]|uniref:hypothetical protein n=1 Tax=Stenotrophomonas maltophilia TaxID=40324 RepID=UPI001660D5D2|nr:hypothetical protein [Stenotrophomonas maltophilia]
MKRWPLGRWRLGRGPDSTPISEQLVQGSQILFYLHAFLSCGGGPWLDARPVVNEIDWVSTCALAQNLGGDLQGHSYII